MGFPKKVDGPDKNQGAGNDTPKKKDPVVNPLTTVDGEGVSSEENLGQAEADSSGDQSDDPNEPQSTYTKE